MVAVLAELREKNWAEMMGMVKVGTSEELLGRLPVKPKAKM